MAAPATTEAGDFGLMNALNEGGVISWSVFVILVIMSIGTFYIMFTKFLQQQKIIKQGNKVRVELLERAQPARRVGQARDQERLSRDRRGRARRPGPAQQADRPGRPA